VNINRGEQFGSYFSGFRLTIAFRQSSIPMAGREPTSMFELAILQYLGRKRAPSR
jgi:hypothetical protein